MRFDVVVIGGGVAGSTASRTLAQAGVNVLQLVRPERLRLPNEVLSPSTRRRLPHDGFWLKSIKALNCAGILSSWASEQPNFASYRLMTGLEGLSTQRNDLHHALVLQALECGAEAQYCSKIDRPKPGLITWEDLNGCRRGARFGMLFLAAGHRSAFGLERADDRIRLDRAVAFATPFRCSDHHDKLIIEASSAGWWYISPAEPEHSYLVYVTEPDLVPRDKAERQKWLINRFEESDLIRSHSTAPPNFAKTIGIDTHFGFHRKLVGDNFVRVGGAAFSLDPLMGNGIARAIDATEMAVAEYIKGGLITETYANFVASIVQEEMRLRAQTYSLTADRFGGSRFWSSKLRMQPSSGRVKATV